MPSKKNNTVRKFKKLALKNDSKIKPVDKYANTLHISPATLNNICMDFTGTSAKQLLLDLKITEAKRLLLYSKMNIN